jgi:murein peptide amidase A
MMGPLRSLSRTDVLAGVSAETPGTGISAAMRARCRASLVVAACALMLLAAAPAGQAGQAGRARRVVIGHSVRGRAITATVLGPDSAPRKILLVGCIHGNECAGLAILSALARRAVPNGIQLWLIGEMNPDGTAAGTRQNADGVDLNRNFPYQWQPVSDPTYYSGPRPLSEPETRAAVKLIRRIRPAVTIWYHQHEDLVDMAGGDRGVARRYAHLAGLRATCLPFLPGTASGWENHTFPGTTSFVVELPAGPVDSSALARHLLALRGVERGERVGSRRGCGP